MPYTINTVEICPWGNNKRDDILYTICRLYFAHCYGSNNDRLNEIMAGMWVNYNDTFRDLLITWLNIYKPEESFYEEVRLDFTVPARDGFSCEIYLANANDGTPLSFSIITPEGTTELTGEATYNHYISLTTPGTSYAVIRYNSGANYKWSINIGAPIGASMTLSTDNCSNLTALIAANDLIEGADLSGVSNGVTNNVDLSGNQLTEEAITATIETLPQGTPGISLICLIPQTTGYPETLTEAQTAALTAKGWEQL